MAGEQWVEERVFFFLIIEKNNHMFTDGNIPTNKKTDDVSNLTCLKLSF